MNKKIAVAGSASLILATALAAAPASADPSRGGMFTLTCNGDTVSVATPPGNGQWTPALVTGSTEVFVPVGFGDDVEGTFYASDGNPLGPVPDLPSGVKRGTRTGQDQQACTFAAEFGPFFDEDFGQTITAKISGTVYVKVTARS